MKLFKIKKSYIFIAAALLIIGGIYYYRQTHSSDGKIRYVTAAAEKGTLTVSISASGNIIVDQQATVDPTITGTVADLAMKVGDKAEKGQFLFNIINDDLSVSVAKAAASYESAKNSLESARIDRDTADEDYDQAKDDDDYTDDEVDILEDKVDLAEAKITQAEKSLAAALADYQNAQSDAGKRKVAAPISGTIQEINVKNGDDLSRTSDAENSSAPIIIGDVATLKAEAQVNEVDIAKVAIGQKAVLKLDALSEMEFSGSVEKIDSLGTTESGVVSYKVTINFDNLDSRIKPDMSVSASIITDVKQDIILVPSSAVKLQAGEKSYVEVLSGGKAERKIVEIGSSNDTQTEIISGLNAGDKIITQTISAGESDSSSSNSDSRSQTRMPGLGGFGR